MFGGRSMIREMMGHDPFEDDPFFRDPFFAGPMGGQMMGGQMMGGQRMGGQMIEGPRGGQRGPGGPGGPGGMQVMDMGGFGGFPNMRNMMSMDMGGMQGGSSMVMMSSSFSSNGQTVHSSSTSARMGPGGVAEIQSQMRDGSGREKIMMERRVGERARRVEKSRNSRTGEEETVDNSYGIDDGMEDQFDMDFQRAVQSGRLPQQMQGRQRMQDPRMVQGQMPQLQGPGRSYPQQARGQPQHRLAIQDGGQYGTHQSASRGGSRRY